MVFVLARVFAILVVALGDASCATDLDQFGRSSPCSGELSKKSLATRRGIAAELVEESSRGLSVSLLQVSPHASSHAPVLELVETSAFRSSAWSKIAVVGVLAVMILAIAALLFMYFSPGRNPKPRALPPEATDTVKEDQHKLFETNRNNGASDDKRSTGAEKTKAASAKKRPEKDRKTSGTTTCCGSGIGQFMRRPQNKEQKGQPNRESADSTPKSSELESCEVTEASTTGSRNAGAFHGLWQQTSMEGNVTEFLTDLGIGISGRQLAWASGYGKGSVFGILMHEGTLFIEEFNGKEVFHSIIQLGSDKPTKQIASEGSPLVPKRIVWTKARLNDDGELEIERYLDEAGTQLWCKAKRRVASDGTSLTTDTCFTLSCGAVALITVTHTKLPYVHPLLEHVQQWSPVLISEQPSPDNENLNSAVSEPLEGYFTSEKTLFDHLIVAFKDHALKPDEKSFELNPISDHEFVKNVTKKDGMEISFKVKCDHERQRCQAAITLNSVVNILGNFDMTFFIQVHKQPLCVESWFQSSKEESSRYLSGKLVNACTQLEELVGKAHYSSNSSTSNSGEENVQHAGPPASKLRRVQESNAGH